MMPSTHLYSRTHDFPTSMQTSPELRRMDMYHRARREEIDAMLFSMSPRQQVDFGRTRTRTRPFAGVLGSIRNGIGHMLISAGSRIQSAA